MNIKQLSRQWTLFINMLKRENYEHISCVAPNTTYMLNTTMTL